MKFRPPAPGRRLLKSGVMGRPDEGNKAQTLVGYSHGTSVSTGDSVTAIGGGVGGFPRVTLAVGGLCWYPFARAVRVD